MVLGLCAQVKQSRWEGVVLGNGGTGTARASLQALSSRPCHLLGFSGPRSNTAMHNFSHTRPSQDVDRRGLAAYVHTQLRSGRKIGRIRSPSILNLVLSSYYRRFIRVHPQLPPHAQCIMRSCTPYEPYRTGLWAHRETALLRAMGVDHTNQVLSEVKKREFSKPFSSNFGKCRAPSRDSTRRDRRGDRRAHLLFDPLVNLHLHAVPCIRFQHIYPANEASLNTAAPSR